MSNYTLPPPQPPQSQPPPQGSAMKGCVKWGLIGCLIVMILGAMGVAAVVLIVFAAVRATPVYEDAMARVRKDPRVIAALGEPIQERWWLTGSVNTDGSDGDANFRIPIKGPNGKATVYVVAKLLGDRRWEFSQLIVQPVGGDEIDLLRQDPAVQPLQPVDP